VVQLHLDLAPILNKTELINDESLSKQLLLERKFE
jgi:hypothetical protein